MLMNIKNLLLPYRRLKKHVQEFRFMLEVGKERVERSRNVCMNQCFPKMLI